ncbi:MAG TPA: class I SAM-dependent methyltransferase [Candidatus Limnocylindria bacterium]|nr:class I SAM-dependent methyltransferase [Candidatus Limnocylindria bacterium]
MSHEEIGRFFDRECCATLEKRPVEGTDGPPLSRQLLAALADAGFLSGTVLELGSGDGSFSRELLRRGALAVSGLDLSAQSVGYAAARASAAGLSERLRYRVADAATARLEPHDAVVSQRVLCCFPDPAGLLANSLSAARSVYALALPESRGLLGLGARLWVRLANGWQWLRRDPFRSFVHDVDELDRLIREAGFVRRSSRRQSIWRVLAYSRA